MEAIKRFMERKIPPPVYGLVAAYLIWWLSTVVPSMALSTSLMKYPGALLMLIGFGIDLTALFQFYQNKTTPNPLASANTSTIVISGLYRYSRNPMYLGLFIVLSGWFVFCGNIAGVIVLPLFVWVINHLQIIPEEQMLSQAFGKPYTDYLARVNRWF